MGVCSSGAMKMSFAAAPEITLPFGVLSTVNFVPSQCAAPPVPATQKSFSEVPQIPSAVGTGVSIHLDQEVPSQRSRYSVWFWKSYAVASANVAEAAQTP